MNKARLEIFSDAVIAIVMTIMVLELKAPEGSDWNALRSTLPVFLSYVMSFVYLSIYWNNHHHMMHVTDHVDGRVLWANLHLLFWLSLVPFATEWMETNHFAALPTALYGAILLLAAIAYSILQTTIVLHHGSNGKLREAIGNDAKGKASLVAYVLAIPLAFFMPWASIAIYVLVGLMWLVPDRRIEKVLQHEHE